MDKAPTQLGPSANLFIPFTFKTLLRHHAKWALTHK